MPRFVVLLFLGLSAALRKHADLVIENLVLRQQLATYANTGRRPRVATTDRWFWIAFHRLWSRWADVLIFVKPETSKPQASKRRRVPVQAKAAGVDPRNPPRHGEAARGAESTGLPGYGGAGR